MAMQGMDVHRVREVASRYEGCADELRQIQQRVDRWVSVSYGCWQGPDGDRFRYAWQGVHRGRIAALINEVQGLATEARRQADQQEAASRRRGGALHHLRASTSRRSRRRTGAHGHDRDMLDLSILSEGGPKDEEIPGYHRLSPEDLRARGFDPALLVDEASGFRADVYLDEDGNYVMAFDATTISPLDPLESAKDLATDALGAHGIAIQEVQAMRAARALQRMAGDAGFEFTGHSLGGGLAAVAAVSTGARATTFDAKGTSDVTLEFATAARLNPDSDVVLDQAGASARTRAAVIGTVTLVLPVTPIHKLLMLAPPKIPFVTEARHAEIVAEAVAPGQITTYSLEGDVVTGMQETLNRSGLQVATAVGEHMVLAQETKVGPLDAHRPENLAAAYDKTFGTESVDYSEPAASTGSIDER